ncbi:hypothetical protein tinsulaeT_12400 [Thalassotalea insulae]|uniref:SpoIIAA-like protein n=1 Tax=Thalassotalea insulae TaxID=2056778 RepID=A0ABQ6GT88_9GAMM|nr:hypothetical protein [Thalassotalea insulae]GLX77900.1 hypothetical protein tinsulaeT_12400 [Thalassotalea insulae]
MKHRLSFAYFNILSDNIVEVVVDEGIEMSLEMIDECHHFIEDHFKEAFGMLINRVNNYTYSYEAKLSIASYQHLKAIAFVYYSECSKAISENLYQIRSLDQWNYRLFSGLELGWQQAFDWLQQELSTVKVS